MEIELVDYAFYKLLAVLIICALIYYSIGLVKQKDKKVIEEKKPLTDYQMNCKLAKYLHSIGKDKERIENSVRILNSLRLELRNDVHQEVLIDWVSNMGEEQITRYLYSDESKKEIIRMMRVGYGS
jgi:hypothetical protein